MGRYAQARRRGKVAPTAQGLPAPPAPVASVLSADVYWTAQGADDTGGRMRLYQANGPLFELATLLTETDWAPEGSIDGVDPGYYWVSEVGNGSAYLGESPTSNMVQVTEG